MPASHYSYAVKKIKQSLPNNQQTYFNDIASAPRIFRKPKSKIIQFYSSYRNIGNYIAVQGIHHVLGYELDVWDIHQTPVDWDYINENYSAAIIGGAGLLHECFQSFWSEFAGGCTLPYVIWGIGLCLPENEDGSGVDKGVVGTVFDGALCANVRDELTRDYYSLTNVDVSICPTVAMIRSQLREGIYSQAKKYSVLHSVHTTLTEDVANEQLNQIIRDRVDSLHCTNNLQSKRVGIKDVLKLYPESDLVVCSRLHGAIIAFAFNVPFIALSFDPKVSAFVELYGGGVLCESADHLRQLLDAKEMPSYYVDMQAEEKALEFGYLAKQMLESV